MGEYIDTVWAAAERYMETGCPEYAGKDCEECRHCDNENCYDSGVYIEEHPVIVDGVDVAPCIYYRYEDGRNCENRNNPLHRCSGAFVCYYKQWKKEVKNAG